MTKTTLAAMLAAIVAATWLGIAVALFWNDGGTQFGQCRGSQVAGGDLGGPFTLVDGTGETVTDEDIITQPSLVYFGYTFCPDVCPLDVARNAVAVDILEEQGHTVTPVFISVDPERDTPEVVGAFADNIHERMIGLTGTPEQVRAASRAYKTYYRSHDDGSDPYYLVDHSTFTYLVLPDHGFVEFFRRESAPQDMADRTACYVEAAS